MRTPALLAVAASAMLAPAAFGQYTFYDQAPIVIGAGAAAPAEAYPGNVFVDPTYFPFAFASRVTVTIHGFSHTWPDDVDILLRNTTYNRTIMLMSDVGGNTAATNLTITLDPDSLTPLADNGPLTNGRFRPTDMEPGENLPAPAPAGPYTGLATLQNSVVPLNGWELYVADDTEQDGGTITAWSLNVYPRDNATRLVSTVGDYVPDVGPCDTYPILLDVFGMESTAHSIITNIRLAHTYPADLDILLVAPDGTSVVLMSDAGGLTPTEYTEISWQAPVTGTGTPIPAPLPTIVTNALPTNLEAGDTWPAPAPPGPYGDSLTPLLPVNPNGTWKLFVNDDAAPDGGILDYWALQINGRTFCAADFNRSGLVSVQDVFDFLTAYFSGCP